MSKRTILWLAIGLIFVGATVVVFAVQGEEESDEPTQGSEQPQTQPQQSADESAPVDTTGLAEDVTELVVEDLVVGDGAEAKSGNLVTVHYTGWLTDGTKFDSSLDRGQPFEFVLGQAQVISGWDAGVAGMKVGGKRKLTIPPDMGYGAQGAGSAIPPNATLVFEVELLAVQ